MFRLEAVVPACFRLLCLLELAFGERVGGGAHDGHSGADDAEASDGRAEDEDRDEDDDDALDRVGHCVRHGRNLAQRKEGHLVVNVVEEAGDGEEREETRVRVALHASRGPGGRDRRGPLEQQRDGEDHQEAENGEHAEHVRGREVLAEGLAVEHLLAQDGLGRRGDCADVGGGSGRKQGRVTGRNVPSIAAADEGGACGGGEGEGCPC